SSFFTIASPHSFRSFQLWVRIYDADRTHSGAIKEYFRSNWRFRSHSIRGAVSWEWKGGGDGNIHSSVVAPMPQGFAAAGIFRRKETATPTRNTSSPANETYDPIEATKFQPEKASG